MRMKLALLALAAAPMLCACPDTGVVNSASAAHACSVEATAAQTIEQLAQVFIAAGIEATRANKIAQAIRLVQMPISVACALVPAPKPV